MDIESFINICTEFVKSEGNRSLNKFERMRYEYIKSIYVSLDAHLKSIYDFEYYIEEILTMFPELANRDLWKDVCSLPFDGVLIFDISAILNSPPVDLNDNFAFEAFCKRFNYNQINLKITKGDCLQLHDRYYINAEKLKGMLNLDFERVYNLADIVPSFEYEINHLDVYMVFNNYMPKCINEDIYYDVSELLANTISNFY